MKYDNQLRYASSIVKQYDGQVPLSAWLKDFFRANKQMGSRDRRTVSEMVYGYYRLGGNVFHSVEDRILAFIQISPLLADERKYFFEENSREPLEIKPDQIFSFNDYLSPDIDAAKFSASFLIQPDLFLRIRPNNHATVLEKLKRSNIPFVYDSGDCLALANNTKIQEVLEINQEVVIQDKSSQATGDYVRMAAEANKAISDVWDCCAASGGKSIMAYDIIQNIKLTASDIRPSIIQNLTKRFEVARIHNYTTYVVDLTDSKNSSPASQYDLVIADVPCTGSGTWARTPEQLYFFRKEKIPYYSNLQMKILSSAAAGVKPGGFLLYITCSVFKQENEDVIDSTTINNRLTLMSSGYLKGYNEKADTLFAALFRAR